jgi:chaperonin cofactor prefoldin
MEGGGLKEYPMSELTNLDPGGLPIRQVVLYKHGVGFFERRGKLDGKEVELSFRAEEMNDVLKSLTIIDRAGGQVLGIEYATPQSRTEQLAGSSIQLDDDRSMRDLLVSLRGRRVGLRLDQGERLTGTLVGLDELPERQAIATSLVSLLVDKGEIGAAGSTDARNAGKSPVPAVAGVETVELGRVKGIEIQDERGASDLRFFLQTALNQERYRRVTVHLTPGAHDLSVSYIAPAPSWQVGYRLVVGEEEGGESNAFLQGWGIFHNRLEEDLEGISLSLVAGMPISFVYDLYTPKKPERPVVQEEERVSPGLVAFEAPTEMQEAVADASLGYGAGRRGIMLPAGREALSREAMLEAAPVSAAGESLGELFQYVIGTPVTVQRGHSALVPIVSHELGSRKDLLYNGSKMPAHPVATLRLKNETDLTLESGPVTVIEGGTYVGEAVLPFTLVGGEMAVPYAVELGAKVREEAGATRNMSTLQIEGAYLRFEEWDIRWREYQIHNSTSRAMTLLVEHPRTAHYELFESMDPKETTDEHLRFEVLVPEHAETQVRIKERRLISRREEVRKQSYQGLRRYLEQGLLDPRVYEKVTELLGLWDRIGELEQQLQEAGQERQAIYKAQQQIQGNMGALSATGKEGALRARYVEELEASEDQLKVLSRQEAEVKSEIERLKAEIEARISALQ